MTSISHIGCRTGKGTLGASRSRLPTPSSQRPRAASRVWKLLREAKPVVIRHDQKLAEPARACLKGQLPWPATANRSKHHTHRFKWGRRRARKPGLPSVSQATSAASITAQQVKVASHKSGKRLAMSTPQREYSFTRSSLLCIRRRQPANLTSCSQSGPAGEAGLRTRTAEGMKRTNLRWCLRYGDFRHYPVVSGTRLISQTAS